MKADLGILLLLVGFTIAYLVLAGKLPSAMPFFGTSTQQQTPTHNPAGNNASGPPNAGNNAGGGPGGTTSLGLPTMGYFHDLVASQGGMQ